MVASIRPLYGITKNFVAYVASLAFESYYASDPNSVWHGSLAKRFGLAGSVDPFTLMNLLVGRSPNGQCLQDYWDKKSRAATTRKPPLPKAGETNCNDDKKNNFQVRDRNPGFDITFSAPKSVSVFYAASSETDRRVILKVLVEAVQETLSALESNVPLTRRGYNGTIQEMGSIAAALFTHFTSRENDAQLHVHALLPNLCRTSDGKFLTINSHLLFKYTRTLGPIFRCELAKGLKRELGTELYIPVRKDGKKKTHFEIVGIPEKLINHSSKRRKGIEKHVQDKGRSLEMATAKEKQDATLETRKNKSEPDDMDRFWEEKKLEAVRFGLTAHKVDKLLGKAGPASLESIFDKAFSETLETITEKHAHFTAREVVKHVCESLQHQGVSGGEVLKRVFHDLNHSAEIVPLSTVKGEQRFTTKKNWQTEEKLLSNIQTLLQRKGATVSNKQIAKTLKKYPTFSNEQSDAATSLLSNERCIRVVSGSGGSGKSFFLKAVREAFENDGYEVIGAALAGAAKEELFRQSGIQSRTIASLLFHLEKSSPQKVKERVTHNLKMLSRAAQKRSTYSRTQVGLNEKTVWVVDEAGMVASGTMHRISEQVVKSGGTLILVGDWKQLPPIEAGGPMHRIVREVGDVRLTENRRQ